MAMNEDELKAAGFSPEEIERMIGDGDDFDDSNPVFDEEGNEITNSDDDDDDDTGGNDDDDDNDDDQADAAAPSQVADQPKEDAQGAVEEETRQFQPYVAPELVEDFDEKMKDFANKQKELLGQLENGDIELGAFLEQRDKLTRDESAMRTTQQIAESEIKRKALEAQQTWDNDQKEFFRAPANKIYESKLLTAALDTAVRELASDPANANKTGKWVLEEADKQVRKEMGITQQQSTQQKPDKRKPDLSVVPKTLSNLPAAADDENAGGKEFAYLDKLDWQQKEAAIAKMSPDQADRYARLVG